MSRILDYEVIGNSLIHHSARIGNNFAIGAFCIIEKDVIIGDDVRMKSYCEIRQGSYIGNNVRFGSRITLAADTVISNDCEIKYGCVFTDTPKIGFDDRQPCVIKEGVQMGANVTVMPGVEIGQRALIGACSQVRQDVPADKVAYGNPAKIYDKKS